MEPPPARIMRWAAPPDLIQAFLLSQKIPLRVSGVCHNAEMITNDIVERACSEVGAYTDDQMMSEFDRFFQKQPGICDFVAELTSESTTEIQELSLFQSYMVFKAAERDALGNLNEVSPEQIETAFHESESWIERIEQAQEDRNALEPDDTEPFLVQYVISELNQPLEDGTVLADEQKGEVFFVLRTVISSFARKPNGKETKS